MFEEQTQEAIMKRMLDSAQEGISTAEGSLLYNACSLMAVALEDAYDFLEKIWANAFEDTCDREQLIRFARKKGMSPLPPTKATYRFDSNVELAVGTVLTDGERDFTVIAAEILRCEEEGTAGNGLTGALEPLEYVEGFEYCEITSQSSFGEDEEETEHFRERYLDALNVAPMYGNRLSYKLLAEGLDEVEKADVSTFSLNSVKWVSVCFTAPGGVAPSAAAVAAVQAKIDPDNTGNGLGLASIGHRVQVTGAAETAINVTASLTLASGAVLDDVVEEVKNVLDTYFGTLNAGFGEGALVVRKSYIESAVIQLATVVDCQVSAINGGSGNYTVPDGHIATRGTLVC